MTTFEDRLRRALRGAAGQRPTRESDWEEFESRMGRRAQERHRIGWRAPLIAAAAVATIAVATSAIVTDGFGLGGRHAASDTGGSAAGAVTVPIVPPAQFAQDAGGAGGDAAGAPGSGPAASNPPSGRSSSAAPDPAASSVVKSTTATPDSVGDATMSFVGGAPPEATLRVTLNLSDLVARPTPSAPVTQDAGTYTSDGTPLGYVALWTEGPTYLWGAVGPDVAQVQVGSVQPAEQGEVDPGFHGGANWIIDSGTGTAFSLPEVATTVWTDLGDGWHGFAVLIPGDATSVSVVAMSPQGVATQIRQFDPTTGAHSDQDLPDQTTPPAPGPTTGPGASEHPAPDATASPAADSGCPFSGGIAMGISDSGFNLGTLEFRANSDGSMVCFFDGLSTWHLNRPSDAMPFSAGLTNVGAFPSQVQGAPTTKGRFLWGVLAPTVASVTISTVDSGTIRAEIDQIAPGARVFFARVPAADPVTAVALDGDGSVLGRSTPGPSGSTQDPPARSASASEVPGATATSDSDRPIIVTYPDDPDNDNMLTALLTGTVTVTNGCVTVTDHDGNVVTPAFPASQMHRADPPALFTFRGKTYAEGSALSVGGGGYTGSHYPDLPSGCPGEVFGVNPGR